MIVLKVFVYQKLQFIATIFFVIKRNNIKELDKISSFFNYLFLCHYISIKIYKKISILLLLIKDME